MNVEEPLDSFETALLADLRANVAQQPTRARRPRWRRRAAALIASGTAVVAVLTFALWPQAAFAVDREPDGDVAVRIRSLDDAEGLESALAKEGVEAEVTYDADAPAPPDGDFELEEQYGDEAPGTNEQHEGSDEGDAPRAGCLSTVRVAMSDDEVTFRLSADAVDSEATLYITTAGGAEDDWSSLAVRWSTPPC